MADNTRQAEWMVFLFANLDDCLPDAFVAMDLLWYPVQGDNKTRLAPDILVAVGRPKGHRGSYKQWEEGIPPTVVFEILSPGNTASEMVNKALWYERYGASEYYLYDPERDDLSGWIRSPQTGRLEPIAALDGWISPALGVRFATTPKFHLFRPEGAPFRSFPDLRRAFDAAEQARRDAERERDTERERAERLAERLRALGIEIEPDA